MVPDDSDRPSSVVVGKDIHPQRPGVQLDSAASNAERAPALSPIAAADPQQLMTCVATTQSPSAPQVLSSGGNPALPFQHTSISFPPSTLPASMTVQVPPCAS